MSDIQVEFRVLCADRKTACNRVKEIMTDFGRIENATKAQVYDHYGSRRFNSLKEAKARRNEIFALAGDDVKGIELVVG